MLHLELQANPKVKAVVHSHPRRMADRVSVAGEAIRMYSPGS
jgi:ribulose-5-phosphate 4-epimerase/fuculose-1-phosphate aldolase